MGIDVERFLDVNIELICSICAGVLEDPVESPCRHVFCSECISRWLNTSQRSCPNCRKKLRSKDLKPPLPILKNIINKLKIRCDFVQDGCTETVELEQLGTHTSSCPFGPMTCENEGCEIIFQRRSKAEHEAECPKRVICCSTTCLQGCGLQITVSEVPGHNCVQSLKSRVEELEKIVSVYSERMATLDETEKRCNELVKKVSDYSKRMLTLEQTVNDLKRGEGNGQREHNSRQLSSQREQSCSSSPIRHGRRRGGNRQLSPQRESSHSQSPIRQEGRRRNRNREWQHSSLPLSPSRESSRSSSPTRPERRRRNRNREQQSPHREERLFRRERSNSGSPIRQELGRRWRRLINCSLPTSLEASSQDST